MFVKPGDHTIAEIQFVAVPIVGEVPRRVVLRVFNLLAEPSKLHKHLVTEKRSDGLVLRSVNDR